MVGFDHMLRGPQYLASGWSLGSFGRRELSGRMTCGQTVPSIASQEAGGVYVPVVGILMANSVQTCTVNEKLTPCKERKVACIRTGCPYHKQCKDC